MNRASRSTLLLFPVVRLAFFAGLFALLHWGAGLEGWIAAVVGAVMAFCISYIFLGRLRDRLSESISQRSVLTVDETAEDSRS